MKPFLRYPGGKGWLVERLVPEIEAQPFKAYHEPFVGAGAIALALSGTPKMVLADFGEAVVNLWQMIAKYPEPLALACQKAYDLFGNNEAGYMKAREKFNVHSRTGVSSAALMIYLNKVCFNGLWRENKRGYMNVPFGDVKKPCLPTVEIFTEIATKLKHATILHKSYQETIPLIDDGDVAFIDPPYDAGYTSYIASGFTEEDQRSLAELLKDAAGRGARLYITNADTPLIREIYAWGVIDALAEPRAIAAKGTSRGRAKCVLIRSR